MTDDTRPESGDVVDRYRVQLSVAASTPVALWDMSHRVAVMADAWESDGLNVTEFRTERVPPGEAILTDAQLIRFIRRARTLLNTDRALINECGHATPGVDDWLTETRGI